MLTMMTPRLACTQRFVFPAAKLLFLLYYRCCGCIDDVITVVVVVVNPTIVRPASLQYSSSRLCFDTTPFSFTIP